MSHSLRVNAILKPCVSSIEASVAFTRGKRLKEMVGWIYARSEHDK